MKINSIPPKELLNKYIHVREKETEANQCSGTDKAEFTSEAKTFSMAFKAAKEAMEITTPQQIQHINQVKQQVDNNTYSVSGKQVAEKILDK